MVGLGIALVLAAVAVELRFRSWRWAVVPALLVGVSGVGAAVAPGGCDAETAYHCAVVVDDPERATGRVLLLDGAPHSYVDLADPTHLEFAYAKGVVAAIDTAYPPGQPLRAYHLGAGRADPAATSSTRPGRAPGAWCRRSTPGWSPSTANGWATTPAARSRCGSRTAGSGCAGWPPAARTWWSGTRSAGSACPGT